MNSADSQDRSKALSEDTQDDLDEAIEDFREREKLGHGFTPVGLLDEIDIGKWDRSRPTFVSKTRLADYKLQLIELLKEYEGLLCPGIGA